MCIAYYRPEGDETEAAVNVLSAGYGCTCSNADSIWLVPGTWTDEYDRYW